MLIFSLITLYMLLGLGLVGFGEEFGSLTMATLPKYICFFFWPIVLVLCALKRIWG